MAKQSSIVVQCFFVHSGLGHTTPSWWSPFEAINLLTDPEKHPEWYQKLIPITKLSVSNKLGAGRTAKITLDSLSNKDIFNYTQADGMVWHTEPFREWEIKLTDRHTPSPSVVFRGFPVIADVTTLDDKEIDGQQDGNWEFNLRLEGLEHFLQNNTGLHQPRTLRGYSYNQILSLLLAELDSRYTPLAHTQVSYNDAAPQYKLEPFNDFDGADINLEIPVSTDSSTWDVLKEIADGLSKYSLNSTGGLLQLPQGNTYVQTIDPDFNLNFIPSNFREGQEPDEWFRNTEDTFVDGTENTRILGESPHYGIIGQSFTAQNEFSGIYVYADPAIIPTNGLVEFRLKYSQNGTPVIKSESLWINTAESSYTFKFPTQPAGAYYFEIESMFADNNIAFKTRQNSTYAGGNLWYNDGTWNAPANEDLEMKLLSPPFIKLSPVITKEHVAVQTSAIVKGLCEECVDAQQKAADFVYDNSSPYGLYEITGTTKIGQEIDYLSSNLNYIDIPVQNVSTTRALAKLSLYDSKFKTILHASALFPIPAEVSEDVYVNIPMGVYLNGTPTYYWELEAISGAFSVKKMSGQTSDRGLITTYVNGAPDPVNQFQSYYISGKGCTGWARYPERMFRNSAAPEYYEAPLPAEYGLRGEREIKVDFSSDWITKGISQYTRCRNLAKEHVNKHNYPFYSAEFTIIGGYVPDLVGKYVLLYNPYEGQDQTFLVTEQNHEYEKGWNSLETSFVATRSGKKP
jgi:hypothetical protein